MAGNIKGIVVEIGGNTAPLDKALQGVNKTSRDLQGELKQVEKLLKLDPTNTELLAQKQKLLADSVDNTKEKLDKLREAEKQVQQQVKEGKVSEEQYRALQREIIATEQKMNELESQGKKTNTVLSDEKPEKNLKDIGSAAENAGKVIAGIGVAGGAAAIGLGVKAFDAANEFKGALNDVVAKTGLADNEMTQFGDTLKNIYANNFGEGYEDIARAMALINQQTGFTGEALQKTTENAIALRDTFDFEVNESMRAAQMLMTQFGITADEAFTLIAQGAQNGLDKNGDLLDTINEYSVHFKQLGFDSEDMFNMLVSGASSGTFSVDKLGDAVKEFGIRTKDGSKATVEAYKSLGLDADELTKKFAEGGEKGNQAFKQVTEALFNIQDPVKQNTIGVSLFGTMWEDLGVQGVKALAQTADAVNKNGDALKKINEIKYDTPKEALQGLGRTIETDVVLPIGEKLMPKIQELISKLQSPEAQTAIQAIATKISDLVNFILDNGSTVISLIASIAAGFVAWSVASTIMGAVEAIKAFKLANEGATIAQWALNAAQNANPVGIIVMLIAGLVTAIITLWNTNEGFRNAIIGIWENIKSAVSTAIETIKGIFNTVIDFVKNNWQALLLLLVNPFAGAFKLLYDNCEGFRTFVDNFVESVKTAFQNAWNAIVSFFTESVPNWIANMKKWFDELPYNLGLAIGTMIANIIQFGVDFLNWITNDLPQLITNIIEWFKKLPGKVWDAITGIINKLSDLKNNMINWAVTELPTFINKFVEVLKDLPQKMVDIGKNIVSGLWDGVTGMTGWLKDKISGFADGIVDGIKSKLQIHSPSRLLADEVGKYMAQGIGVGFENEMGSVSNSMAKAIPTTKQSYIDNSDSTSVASGTNSSFAEATINIPLSLEGKTITNVVSKVQYSNEWFKARIGGVTP